MGLGPSSANPNSDIRVKISDSNQFALAENNDENSRRERMLEIHENGENASRSSKVLTSAGSNEQDDGYEQNEDLNLVGDTLDSLSNRSG